MTTPTAQPADLDLEQRIREVELEEDDGGDEWGDGRSC